MKTYWMPKGNWDATASEKNIDRLMSRMGLYKSLESATADVLVLGGGIDIGKNLERDRVEIQALEEFRHKKKAVFGICRGMQLMLWTEGVPMIEHLPDIENLLEHRSSTGDWQGHSGWHTTEEGLLVNSRHHQGFLEAGNWTIADRTQDGVIEAVHRGNQFGVQWHPELAEIREADSLDWLKWSFDRQKIR
jgi:gamma-glutamyl-gamma-aminobutyrate hydrolase PuuD